MARDWQSQDLNPRGLAIELTSLGKFSERPILSQGLGGGDAGWGDWRGYVLRVKG